MARTVSTTKASTAKSTPPKTGTDAQIQRMNNTVKSLSNSLDNAGIRSLFNNALKMQGNNPRGNTISDADIKARIRGRKTHSRKAKKK